MTAWIFQGNPKEFKVEEYLRRQDTIIWTVRQSWFQRDISVGDEVFIWRSDGDEPKSGGIVARGRILSPVVTMEDDAPELWLKKREKAVEPRVVIKIEEARLAGAEGMLRRVELEKDPGLRSLGILSVRNQTNYKVDPRHAERLNQLWSGA